MMVGNAVQTDEPRRARILFVDDDPSVLRAVRRALHGDARRWEMTFALGGASGLAEIETRRFDLVVTDLEMPGNDGREIMRAAKESCPQIRCIVQTGSGIDPELLPDACAVLVKPVRVQDLRSVLERFAIAGLCDPA